MSGRRQRVGFFGSGRGRGRRLRTGKRIGILVEEPGGQVSERRVSASGQEMESGFRRVTYPAKKDIGDEPKREGAGYRDEKSKLCHVSNICETAARQHKGRVNPWPFSSPFQWKLAQQIVCRYIDQVSRVVMRR